VKIITLLLAVTLGMVIVACASSSLPTQVRKIGDNQYEVFAKSRSIGKDSELVSDWNTKARETCGGDFDVISRNFNSQTQGSSTMTGVISCK